MFDRVTRRSARWARRTRQHKLLTVAAVLALVTAMSGLYSLALFTDSQDVTNNDFTAGEIDISTDVTTNLLVDANLMPGDSGVAALVVSNNGNAQLRYAISAAATNADTLNLRDVLNITIKQIDVTTPGTPCDNFDGVQLFSGIANTANMVGDPTTGADAGDRTLAGAASETLCIGYDLPSGTGNAYQTAFTSLTFSFAAEQTDNN